MIDAYPDQRFEALLTNAPTGLVGTMTFSIINPETGVEVVAARTIGITEPVEGTYWTSATAPDTPDEYMVVWSAGGNSAVEGLLVDEAPALRPTLEQVSLLLRTRTVGPSIGLGGDTAPGDLTVFNEGTRPTDVEVENMIDMAYGVMVGKLGGEAAVPESRYGQVQVAIAAYTAMMIAKSFFAEQFTDDDEEYFESFITDALAGVDEDVEAASGSFGFGVLMVGTTRELPEAYPVDTIADEEWTAGWTP